MIFFYSANISIIHYSGETIFRRIKNIFCCFPQNLHKKPKKLFAFQKKTLPLPFKITVSSIWFSVAAGIS